MSAGDTESTSAALARVTDERDFALDEIKGWREHSAEHRAEIDRLEELVIKRSTERDALHAELAEAIASAVELAPAPVDAYDAWACLADGGCGRRYGYSDPETHELTCGRALTPVRVTITRRTAGEPLEEGKAPHA